MTAGGVDSAGGASVNNQAGSSHGFDPSLEGLRRKKAKTKAVNLQVDERIVDTFLAFVDDNDLAKGATAGRAMQQFLERHGAPVPGVSDPTMFPERNGASLGPTTDQ
ncbi:hypothetical protein [Mycobacteroides abscessus]